MNLSFSEQNLRVSDPTYSAGDMIEDFHCFKILFGLYLFVI